MQHDAIEAVPTVASGDKVDKDKLRNVLVKRFVYVLGYDEDPAAFDALDLETGSIPEAIAWRGGTYFLDSDDFIAEGDNDLVIETNDGYRYIREGVSLKDDAVLSRLLDTPPDEEDLTFGDAYLVPNGATGVWGSHPDEVSIWTPRGWRYFSPRIGRLLYIRDEDVYIHLNDSGDWIDGVGQSSLSPNSVRPSHLLGGKTDWLVVNATTNVPPVSPTTGVAYLIATSPSPTGAWAGHGNKIAQWTGTAWLIHTPTTGWTVEDQTTGIKLRYSGAAWVAQRGAIIDAGVVGPLTDPTTTTGGAGNYAFSKTTAPRTDTNVWRKDESTKLTIKALTGQRINFNFALVGNSNTINCFAVFRDNEVIAVDWTGYMTTTADHQNHGTFSILVADDNSHVYRLAAIQTGGNAVITVFHRTRFGYEVIA